MVDNTWVMDLPQIITTIVSTRGKTRLAETYPNASWTEDDIKNAPSVFPTILFSYTMTEMGADLIGQDVNAVMLMVQVDVTVTKEQGIQGARYVSGVVMDELKKLSFYVSDLPNPEDNTSDLIRYVFRARRVVGQADTFNS